MDKTRKTSNTRPRRSFTPEFKAEAVRLCRIGDRSVAEVGRLRRENRQLQLERDAVRWSTPTAAGSTATRTT